MSSQFASDTPPPGRSGRLVRAMPYVLIVAAVIADLATPKDISFAATLSVPPALGVPVTPLRQLRPLLIGLLCVIISLLLSLYADGIPQVVIIGTEFSVVTVTLMAWAVVRYTQRQQRMLTDVRTVAEVAQQVLLRALPTDLVSVRSAVRYAAAAAEARIGGDLYEVMTTPFGDRLIIGDVRGKGLPAVEAAADVLGIFREAAHQEGELGAIALRMHQALARRPQSDTEEFVTAVLVSIPPGSAQAELVNCGHPAPLRIHQGAVTALDPPETSPPLGLFDLAGDPPQVYKADFVPGDMMLLYTDGTTEARDKRGSFFRLDPASPIWAEYQEPDPLLDHVLRAVHEHAGPRLTDDLALLAVKRLPDP
ncbi:serine/threonine-protein phosphatase [Actinospica sp. MGRD01-02]|uniref:Serine/threonine-protein phosphatase n=1 Tax=Actinospica acidithermotolerans TaxID=2828514 RepID=A0A941EAM1_9ACTN|nr:PP2C family protein-serine/threonine phosphatase [Actinospica acidithermotolerans]MBR7826912.1 serine/threonine-protein phosphatase [Actinospica acidithermotolerans]